MANCIMCGKELKWDHAKYCNLCRQKKDDEFGLKQHAEYQSRKEKSKMKEWINIKSLHMFNELKINMSNAWEYLWIKWNTLSQKLYSWVWLNRNQAELFRDYLEIKIKDMIRIVKELNRFLDDN